MTKERRELSAALRVSRIMELAFRIAGPKDCQAVVDLAESAYRGESSRVGWTTEADLLDGRRTGMDELSVLVEREDAALLLAFSGDELVACAKLERVGEEVHFGMFAVRPERQGGGLGRRVLQEAERRAKRDFCAAQLHMQVIRQRDELIAWYERRGYARTGKLLPFPYGDERFGIPRREDLIFEELVKAL